MVAQFSNQQAFSSFDIRNFQDQLEPSKTKNKFICPVCGGNDLSIVPETGKYRCFNNCECKDIREAIKPWAEVIAERAGANYTPSLNRNVAKAKRILPKSAPIPDGELGLVMLTDTVTDIPQPKKLTSRPPKNVEGSATETIYPYSESQWVVRYQWPDDNKEKGYSKTFRQWHRREDGTPEMRKGDEPWKAYRIDEALAAAKSVNGTPALLQHEGEGCVEVGREHGLAGITFQGSGWDKKTITLEYQRAIEAGIGLIVFLHDPDDTGLKKLATCLECAAEVGIALVGINPNDICPDLPYKSSDIKEILGQMEVPEFIRRLEQEIHAAVAQRSLELVESETIEKEVTDLSNFSIDIDPADPEAFYKPVCQSMNLPYSNCVTSGTFDGWAYRKIFPQTEWMVLNSSFYKWSQENKQWQHQDDNKAYKLLADASESAYKLSYTKTFGWRITKPYETNAHVDSAFKYCRSRLEPAEPLPTNTHLLGFNNCVVDLRTGEQMPLSKDFYLTNIIPHDYEANKPCPEVFLKFLNESFGSELVEVIRAFTSMFLDPTAPYGRFPHLIGLSGGGKGTLGRFWSSLFGESGSSSATHFADISTPEGRHQYLSGKRIFGFPDVGGYAEGVRAFYELVDNGAMSGRALFNPVAYSIQWYIRFWVASVSHLQIENAGDGWMRRAYPIPVKNRDVTPDPDLWLKLQEVKSDIISWALAMPRAERDRILLSPPSSDRAKNLALEASLYGDSTKSFVDLCLRPSTTETFIPQSRLHSWYVLYCREHGYAPLGMSKFISHLKTVLPHNFKERSWTPTVNGKRERIQSHFAFIEPLAGVFEMKVPEGPPDSSLSKAEFWYCFKDKCLEGGIEEFEEFFHPTKTPEPLHSLPVHPVHSRNTPTFDPGQAESLTQLGCPPCPIVPPQELALQKKDEENNESGVNQFVNLTHSPSVPLDFVDSLDSLDVTGFEPVQQVSLAENSLDTLDSPAVAGFSPRQDGELITTRESELSCPELKVGDKVEFFNDSVRKWQVGIIKSVQLMKAYFCSATIEYRGFKGQLCQVEIFRSDWIKFLHN
ncbi:primase-like DNA-binding domain-containing protein [Nostoc sp. PA-18-2419]|uniref:primase-like DNA-binding domain-containing protein n=1 Tax=Nostoc sp. PA-18-2419 TaxID=2575443 RepID=UPI001109948F|nr:primase-like DNA-binding domain-containing protein [Nostoc sp. PA-18-2419]